MPELVCELRGAAVQQLDANCRPLRFLIGERTTVGAHGLVPGMTYHGRTSFEWLAGGAFLIMHSEIDESGSSNGIAIFGSDDAVAE